MVLTDNLAAYWAMDQAFELGFDALDSVPPNRYQLTRRPAAVPIAYPSSGSGIIESSSKSVLFPAYDTTGIRRATLYYSGAAAPFILNGDRTFAFWFKVNRKDVQAVNRTLFFNGVNNGLHDYGIVIDATTFQIKFGRSSGYVTHPDVIQEGQAYFVVFYYRHAEAKVFLKLNDGIPASGAISVVNNGFDFVIGDNGSIEGHVDEFGLWTRELTAAEMAQLYNDGEGMSYDDIVEASTTQPCRGDTATCCDNPLDSYNSDAGTGQGFDSSCEPYPKVIFEPPSGSKLILPSLVLLRSDNPDAVIHYTTDGSEPDRNSTIYSSALTVESPATLIRAIAIVEGCDEGPEATAQYQTWTPAAHFTYACTTTDRSGQWGGFAADGNADYNWQLQIQFTASTAVKRFDILQLFPSGKFTGAVWSTKEFVTPWEDDITKQHRAFPLVIWITGVQQNFAYLDDYSASLGNFSGAAHTLDMYGQPWTALPTTNVFKLLVTFSDGTTVARIVDSTCDALPGALCPVPSITLTPACGPFRIDVTFTLTVGTPFTIFRAISGSSEFEIIFDDTVAFSPQTYQDTAVTAGVTYDYVISNLPTGCVIDTFSPITTAQAIPLASVSISASPTTIDSGGSTTVSWNSSNNSGTVSISPTIGAQAGNVPGSQVVSPAVTTTYTITGQNSCGTQSTAQVTVTVNPPATCGVSQPELVGISGYNDTMFVSALIACSGLRSGGVAAWNGQFFHGGGCGFAPPNLPFSLIIGRELNLTFTRITFSGGTWTLQVYGYIGATDRDIWTGTKVVGDSPVGTYTRASGCATLPTSVSVVVV